jgi:hypothetical protein
MPPTNQPPPVQEDVPRSRAVDRMPLEAAANEGLSAVKQVMEAQGHRLSPHQERSIINSLMGRSNAVNEGEWQQYGCLFFSNDFDQVRIGVEVLSLYTARQAQLFFKCLCKNGAYGVHAPLILKGDIRAYLERNGCKVPANWTPSSALKGRLAPLVRAYEVNGTRSAFRIAETLRIPKTRSMSLRVPKPGNLKRSQ